MDLAANAKAKLSNMLSEDTKEMSSLEQVKTRATASHVGEVHDLKKNFSLFALLGISFSLANSWFGISTSLITGINSGGPVLLIYGTIIVTIVCTAIAVSLSELASAMPHAGGQYHWAAQLAPAKYARFAAYTTGFISWLGSLFTCASIALGVGTLCVGCIQLSHPDLDIKPWMVFVAYQVIKIASSLANCWGRALPLLTFSTLWISIISFMVIIITVPAKASSHQSASFVFTEFINNTGWKSDGIAFIVGLINPNWAFNGLDCANHMAEETLNPERDIPIAIMGTVAIGFTTSWLFAIAMMFALGDFDNVAGTSTGVPILELFNEALSSTVGSIVLCSMIIFTGCGCLIASHTWQARLCWSFSRDSGLPFSKQLAKVHPRLRVPINAHFFSTAIVSVLGCLYLGSYTAFNSMVTACVVLLYASYAIPVGCLLLRGRSNIRHGPFWLGGIGHMCNYILLAWLVFAFVMYSFPPIYPVTAGNMNYVSAVYFVSLSIVIVWWHVDARKTFRG
ncbi:hypothetical protein M409DRAFT_68427 [Zasmidium cellare ATCC 36951]|uniref:Choline transport protein n=1 Tax=Zasmidium cellare ATCC 36951 TaxID=1080233 RepID=A0A6A6CCR7_ZASCE|nr:uncharacterized protein M409DRAFT_68427 [Zasmidium cellare ATCC 36951]KAF2163489.1 hypothetical protein M409DRAFT_68427 [Zasmidium cellare ATCC 36951]